MEEREGEWSEEHTNPNDKLVELQRSIAELKDFVFNSRTKYMFPFRVGQGYDVHQLVEGRPFWLGGISIPHSHGAKGHSDADVVCHVMCDALLGAANMRNIGYHFSDKDPQWKGVDSKILLAKVLEMIREKGFQVGNVDVTIVLQNPKLNPHIPEMKACLSSVTNIPEQDISIKATTSEHLGFVGREEGIAAHCVALIYLPNFFPINNDH